MGLFKGTTCVSKIVTSNAVIFLLKYFQTAQRHNAACSGRRLPETSRHPGWLSAWGLKRST